MVQEVITLIIAVIGAMTIGDMFGNLLERILTKWGNGRKA